MGGAGEPPALIDLKPGTRIWIAAGFSDLRRGFQGLSSIVETVLRVVHVRPLPSIDPISVRGKSSRDFSVKS